MKKTILILFGLVILQGVIDFFYAKALPDLVVSPQRALVIGVTAIVLLFLINLIKDNLLPPVLGGLSIFSSAFFGALLVQANYLISKSFLSAVVHIAILIITYLILIKINNIR